MGLRSCSKDAILPFIAMVVIECGEVGMSTISKAALNTGMSNLVYIVYYNALGILIFLPYFIFHFHRNKPPPLTFALLCRFFLLGFLGKCLEIFGYAGINYSSPTLAAALGNLTPVFTFMLAIIFRMEKIDMRSSSSQAKSVGTIVAVSGALIVTLYKGPPILFNNTSSSTLPPQLLLSQPSKWVLGGIFLAIGYIFASTWSVLQAATVKEYPEELTVVFFFTLFGTIQCAVFSLMVERNLSAWTFHPGIEMIATGYSAIFGMLRSTVTTWCLHKKGPLFVAMIKPLAMVIAMFAGVVFLGDILYIGSVIGAIIIAFGFYTVIWGQAREKDVAADKVCRLESPTQNTALLQNYDTERI